MDISCYPVYTFEGHTPMQLHNFMVLVWCWYGVGMRRYQPNTLPSPFQV